MVISLKESFIEIKREGLSKEADNYLVNEFEWGRTCNLVEFESTTSRYKVYGEARALYHTLRRISKDYSVELV